jgi:glycosyltransferase involved in cell wall biosynthesis
MLGLARQVSPGIHTLVASFSEGGRCRSFLDRCRDEGFEAIELTHDTPHLLQAIEELAAIIRTRNVSIVLTHTFKPNILGHFAARRAGVPHVVVSRGWTGESWKVRLYEGLDRVFLRWADHVVAVSRGQAEKVRRCGVSARRIAVIRNAASLDPQRPVHLREPATGSPKVLAAGRLSPEKGFDTLVAAAKLTDPAVTFVLYGEGSERSALQRQIDDQGLSSRFRLAGFTPDINRHLPEAALVVLPSRTEGLPNVALEAAAAGRAIVATAVGGTPEIVRQGVNGLLVPPNQPAAMAAAIMELLNDHPRRIAMGHAGRDLAEREFSFAAQAEAYRRLGADLTRPAAIPFPIRPQPTARIAFVIDDLSRAGTETQLLALIRGLDRSRFTPELILLRGESPSSKSLEPHDCDVVRLGVSSLLSTRAMKAVRRLRCRWQANRPDLVVSYFLDASYVAIPVAKSLGIETARVRNHLGYWQSPLHRLMGRLLRPLTDRILTNSEDARRELVNRDGIAAHRITVIENGVDADRFAAVPPIGRQTPMRIGCVANLRPVKNIDGLIRAAAGIPPVPVVIAGEGPSRGECERLIASLGLRERVKLAGSVSDIPGFLASCPIVILPSHSESLSNALLEAMAAGRAIIATDVGANRQVLGPCGLIVPPRDDRALAEAIRELMADRDRMMAFGQAAKRRAISHYARRRSVQQFESLFQSVRMARRRAA